MNAALRQLIAPLAIVFCAVLAGCNGTIGALEPAFSVSSNDEETDKDAGQQVIGKPYKVGGRWYHPKEDEEYDKSGLASWYGSKFHGRRTASGEAFDQNALTAAHPTLPLPSYVRVTVEKTGKSTVVRATIAARLPAGGSSTFPRPLPRSSASAGPATPRFVSNISAPPRPQVGTRKPVSRRLRTARNPPSPDAASSASARRTRMPERTTDGTSRSASRRPRRSRASPTRFPVSHSATFASLSRKSR